jgi:large subunit ribosomal protein L29
MADMKSRELRAKSDEDLLDLFDDLKEELYMLRLNKSTGELVDTTEIRRTKRTLARALTVLRERELAAAIAEGES